MLEVIVDSTCDLSKDLMSEYEIEYIPHRIYLRGKEYYDRLTINAEEVYDAMKKGATLTSHLRVGGVGVFFLNKKPELYIK